MNSPLTPPLVVLLNHLLASAEWARKRLRPHAGQSMAIQLPFGPVRLVVANDGTLAESSGGEAPDLTLTISEGAVLAALDSSDAALKHVRIAGNADFGEALGFVMRNLEWDAEADLARIVGDVAAPRLNRGARAFIGWQKALFANGVATVKDFLVYERPTLVARDALDQWAGDLLALGDDLARLEKRLAKLTSRR